MIRISKIIVSWILLISFIKCQDDNKFRPPPTYSDFKNWMNEYDKHYDYQTTKNKFETFVTNHFLVEKLNQIYNGETEFKLNAFADLTPEEFRERILMSSDRKPFLKHNKFLPNFELDEIPESFDWRDRNVVTTVKDQGGVGTCWAFSTVQNLEGQYAIKGNQLLNLSVEQIVDCDGSYNGTSDQADCGVYGGWPYLAFDYVKEAGGIESEDDYPYCAGTNKPCFPCEAPGFNKTECGPPIPYCFLKDSCQAKINPDKFVKNLVVVDWQQASLNETEIAEQLMTIGPMSVALNAELLQFYYRGVFDPFTCNAQDLNHAVLLVGWGVNRSKLFGNKPYWLVKNSWGPKWGEKGYFRIVRNKGKCGINTQVVTAILA